MFFLPIVTRVTTRDDPFFPSPVSDNDSRSMGDGWVMDVDDYCTTRAMATTMATMTMATKSAMAMKTTKTRRARTMASATGGTSRAMETRRRRDARERWTLYRLNIPRDD